MGCEVSKCRVIGLIPLVRSNGLLSLLFAFLFSTALGIRLLQEHAPRKVILDLLKLRVWEVNIHFAAQDDIERVQKFFLLVNALVWLQYSDLERFNQVVLILLVEVCELLIKSEVLQTVKHLRFSLEFQKAAVVKPLPLVSVFVLHVHIQSFPLQRVRMVALTMRL